MPADVGCCMVFLVSQKRSCSMIGEIQLHPWQDLLTNIYHGEPQIGQTSKQKVAQC